MSPAQDSGNIREERAETAQELEDRKKCYEMLFWTRLGCHPRELTAAVALCTRLHSNTRSWMREGLIRLRPFQKSLRL